MPGSHPLQEDDRRFEPLAPDVPKASIALAIFLMCFGIFSLVAAWLHFTQRVLGKAQAVGFVEWRVACCDTGEVDNRKEGGFSLGWSWSLIGVPVLSCHIYERCGSKVARRWSSQMSIRAITVCSNPLHAGDWFHCPWRPDFYAR